MNYDLRFWWDRSRVFIVQCECFMRFYISVVKRSEDRVSKILFPKRSVSIEAKITMFKYLKWVNEFNKTRKSEAEFTLP